VSDMPTDPTAGAPDGQPSEEEVRAYIAQLRGAGVDQILAEVLSSLLNAAQVKLGRRDARVLLDTTAAMVDQTRAVLPAELTNQVDDVLSQLRVAQVQAESEVAQAAAQGQQEPNDLPASGQAADTGDASDDSSDEGTPPPSPSQPAAGQQAASRLWVPGQ
jgi:hypothetical protein